MLVCSNGLRIVSTGPTISFLPTHLWERVWGIHLESTRAESGALVGGLKRLAIGSLYHFQTRLNAPASSRSGHGYQRNQVQQQIGALQLRHLEASKYWMNHSQLNLTVPPSRGIQSTTTSSHLPYQNQHKHG